MDWQFSYLVRPIRGYNVNNSMKKLLLRWILLAFSVVIASMITQSLGLGFQADAHDVGSFLKLLLGVALLSFLNATLGPVLKFMSLPLRCITLGLFSFVVNGAVLWIAGTFQLGFSITAPGLGGFIAALVASILISAINGALGVFIPDDKE